MTKTTSKFYQDAFDRVREGKSNWEMENFKEEVVDSVLINGEFHLVSFLRIRDRYFIVIGTCDSYTYRFNEYRGCIGVDIFQNEQWFSVTKDEGNRIYLEIMRSKKLSKKGNPYYRWNIKL